MNLRALKPLLVGCAVFFIAGLGFIFWGSQTNPTELTNDGYSLKNFFFIMGGVFILIPVGLVFYALRKQRNLSKLIEDGKQGIARILQLEDTGVRVNENPRVRVLLEISIEGIASYQVWKKVTVPVIRLPQIQPGMEIAVVADPFDPQNAKKIGLLLR